MRFTLKSLQCAGCIHSVFQTRFSIFESMIRPLLAVARMLPGPNGAFHLVAATIERFLIFDQ